MALASGSRRTSRGERVGFAEVSEERPGHLTPSKPSARPGPASWSRPVSRCAQRGLTRSLRPLTIGADEEANPPTEALDTT